MEGPENSKSSLIPEWGVDKIFIDDQHQIPTKEFTNYTKENQFSEVQTLPELLKDSNEQGEYLDTFKTVQSGAHMEETKTI